MDLLWDFFFFCCESFSFAVRLSFPARIFLLLWDFFFFVVIIFISPWDFLFLCETFYFPRETFYFPLRLLISLWDSLFLCETFYFTSETFSFPCENISPENYFTLSENFWLTMKEGFDRLCSLCSVLWARHSYSLEKKMSREQICFGRLCSL